MRDSIKLYADVFGKRTQIPIYFSTFPGGEEYVRCQWRNIPKYATAVIVAHISDSISFMRLLMLMDAVQKADSLQLHRVIIPYLPYARQDKMFKSGEALSLNLAVKLLASASTEDTEFWSFDVHNKIATENVFSANLRNFRNIDMSSILHLLYDYPQLFGAVDMVVAPDNGARSRAKSFAAIVGKPLLSLDKRRDKLSGKVDRLTVGTSQIKQLSELKSVLIVDDICDGGATFVKAAELLRLHGVQKVHLFVTHGIFSNGVPIKGIDSIITTNTIASQYQLIDSKVDVLRIPMLTDLDLSPGNRNFE